MGVCRSSANKSDERHSVNIEKKIPSIFINNKPILKDDEKIDNSKKDVSVWDEFDVYEWLNKAGKGELESLATQFRQSRIRGRVLEDINDEQLNEMQIVIGDKLLFKRLREELFARKIKYRKPIPSPTKSASREEGRINPEIATSISYTRTPITSEREQLSQPKPNNALQIPNIPFRISDESIFNQHTAAATELEEDNYGIINADDLATDLQHMQRPQRVLNTMSFMPSNSCSLRYLPTYQQQHQQQRKTLHLPQPRQPITNPNDVTPGTRVYVYVDSSKEWREGVVLTKDKYNLIKISVYTSLSQISHKYIQLPDTRVQLSISPQYSAKTIQQSPNSHSIYS